MARIVGTFIRPKREAEHRDSELEHQVDLEVERLVDLVPQRLPRGSSRRAKFLDSINKAEGEGGAEDVVGVRTPTNFSKACRHQVLEE